MDTVELIEFLSAPENLPLDQHTNGKLALRYEDITQVGRVRVVALPASGGVVWRNLLANRSFDPENGGHVYPILSRLVVATEDVRLPIFPWFDVTGCYQLAHSRNDAGEVERLYLNVWSDVGGRTGRTNAPQPENTGQRVVAGRILAEHVFTRPFGPLSQRKVHQLNIEGFPPVPPDIHTWRSRLAILEIPPNWEVLDPSPTDDESHFVFGLDHTDSNQHVNSLVFPDLFEQACLRRFAAHGIAGKIQSTGFEAGFRKPCFAGDSVLVVLRAFKHGRQLGAVGIFAPKSEATNGSEWNPKPYCYLRMAFGVFGD